MRRIILMAVTIFSGSVLIFYDAPIFLVILTTFLVGFMMLILLGIMRISVASEEDETPSGEVKTLFKPLNRKEDAAGEELPAASAKRTLSGHRDVLRAIPGKVREAIETVSASFSRKGNGSQEREKIDRMLDRTISEDPFQAEEFPDFPEFDQSFDNDQIGDVENRISETIDKLSALSTEDLISLESEIEHKLHGDEEETRLNIDFDEEEFSQLPGGEDDDSRLSSSELKELEGLSGLTDFDFEDEGLDTGFDVDLDSLDNMDLEDDDLDSLNDLDLEDDDLDSLNDLDLEDDALDIKIDEENVSTPSLMEEEPEELEIAIDEEPTVPVHEPSAPVAQADVKIEGFGLPGSDESNLLDMLQSDSKPKKSVVDVSLVRDLKDTKVTAEELADELEDVLVFLNKKNQ